MAIERRQPTMIDVAKEAGVSLKTVSRVVNAEPGTSVNTQERVKAAIETLGYRRNNAASELRSGRSGLVGLVVEDISEPFQSELARSIEEVLEREGLLLLSASTGADVDRGHKVLTALAERRVDGLIIFPSFDDYSFMEPLLGDFTQVVFVDRPPKGLAGGSVRSDHRGGAFAATSRLIDLGHTRIAYLGDPTSLYTGAERFAGYMEALIDHALPFDPALVHLQNPVGGTVGNAFKEIMSLEDPPTAVFTGNSLTTIHLLRHPGFESDKIAHIAFDDLLLADVLAVPLTTVSQDVSMIGATAANMIQERIFGNTGDYETVVLPTRLILRESDLINLRS